MGVAPAIASGIGAATQAGQAISSGVKGNRAANQANQALSRSDEMVSDLSGLGMDQMGQINRMLEGFQNPELADQIMRDVMAGGQMLTHQGNQAADQLLDGSLLGQATDHFGSGGMLGTLDQMGGLQGFDFDPARQTAQLAQDQAMQFADHQRASAQEQAALSMQQQGGGLDAMMADRGLGRGSGVAAEAMAGLGGQQAQAMSQLNRDLADLGGEQALQAGQFDAQLAQQFAGMGAQHALGMDQLRGGLAGQQAQFDLGAGQGMLGAEAQRGQNLLAAHDLRSRAITEPIAMQQGMYQQNFLAPQMQMASMLNPTALLGTAMQGMQGNLDRRLDMADIAGGGKGAATGGALGGLGDLGNTLGGKSAGTPPSPGGNTLGGKSAGTPTMNTRPGTPPSPGGRGAPGRGRG